jgi:hypothetical protein
MSLLSQVLGVAGAGIAISVLWRRSGASNPALAVGIVAAVLATALAWPNAWRSGDQLDQMRRDAPAIDRFQADLHGGRGLGVDVEFLLWAADRIPPGATFAMLPPASDAVYQWATYQLFPRRYVPEENADYILFYGIEPTRSKYDRAEFGRPAVYGSGLGIVRRRGAR